MGAKQRRVGSQDAPKSTEAVKSRHKREKDFATVKKLCQIFVLIIGIVFSATAILYMRGWTKMAELRAKEAKLDAKMEKLRQEAHPELEKGKMMLRGQHATGLELLRSVNASGRIEALETHWLDMGEDDRTRLWELSARKLLEDPAFAPLLKAEGARLTDTLVPELYAAEKYAREPERMRRLVNLLLDGNENGLPQKNKKKGRPNQAAVDHKEARNLYRSAILSRFVQGFVVELDKSADGGEEEEEEE